MSRTGTNLVRAELPGIDPEKDLEVTVGEGVLTIKAEGKEQTETKKRTEFRYGAFTRSMTLPEGADTGHIQASHDKGVLEISVAMKEKPGPKEVRIPVMVNQHIKAT